MNIQKNSQVQKLWGSMCAAIAQVAVGHPFDTVKTCLQNKSTMQLTSPRFFYRGWKYPLISATFNNIMGFGAFNEIRNLTRTSDLPGGNVLLAGCVAGAAVTPTVFIFDGCKILRQVGLQASPFIMLQRRGFYATLARECIGMSAYFSTYTFAREKCNWNPFIAGSFAGFWNWTLSYPIDVIRSRQVAGNVQVLDALRPGHLWRGYPICICRGVLVNGAIFWTYEHSQALLNNV